MALNEQIESFILAQMLYYEPEEFKKKFSHIVVDGHEEFYIMRIIDSSLEFNNIDIYNDRIVFTFKKNYDIFGKNHFEKQGSIVEQDKSLYCKVIVRDTPEKLALYLNDIKKHLMLIRFELQSNQMCLAC